MPFVLFIGCLIVGFAPLPDKTFPFERLAQLPLWQNDTLFREAWVGGLHNPQLGANDLDEDRLGLFAFNREENKTSTFSHNGDTHYAGQYNPIFVDNTADGLPDLLIASNDDRPQSDNFVWRYLTATDTAAKDTTHFGFDTNRFLLSDMVDKGTKKVDSLILNSNFIDAEKEIDYLEKKLDTHKNKAEYIELKAMLMLRKSDLYLRKEQFSKGGEIALTVIDLAKEYNLPEVEYKACLIAALTYEQANYLELCKKYLDQAYSIYQKNKLEHLFSTYCIRVSSYYRFAGKTEQATDFAYKALDYAQRYGDNRDLLDAHLLLGIFLRKTNYQESIKHTSFAAKSFLNRNDYNAGAAMYNNIAKGYYLNKKYNESFLYSDSALFIQRKYPLTEGTSAYIFKLRSELFDSIGRIDSAYYYFKQYNDYNLTANKNIEVTEIKDITEKYENHKKESTIENQKKQLAFIIILLMVVAGAAILIMQRNIKINAQNKIINKQLAEIVKTLEQKQVLLLEFQHRVKNNMQHMISILEMQKESMGFNNMEELIRSSQNRIYSMALLHKKLHVSDNVNEVDLKRYLVELSELIRNSYNDEKTVTLTNTCDIHSISIEKALPLGLIIVELISNSIKHAFEHTPNGTIDIKITKDAISQTNKLHYADNGSGFDFEKTPEKGLGIEIIKGLIDQINGTVTTANQGGFNFILYF